MFISTQELQLYLISQILETADEDVLKLLQKTLLKQQTTKSRKKPSIHDPRNPYYDKLTSEEEKGVGEALEDYKNGKYVSFEPEEEVSIKKMEEKFIQKFGKDW